jgi:hypothetical protein
VITSYSELLTEMGNNWPNRSDLGDRRKTFVQLAEAAFKRDPRFRRLAVVNLSVSQDALTLPSDLRSPESWEYNTGSHFGEIDVVSMGQLSAIKARYGTTGIPRAAAIVNGVAYFAPVPDQTYATRFTYWRKITSLSDTQTTNWLLDAHPDAYLYGALLHLEGYMKNDPRIATWQSIYEAIAEQINTDAENSQFGGALHVQHKTIG